MFLHHTSLYFHELDIILYVDVWKSDLGTKLNLYVKRPRFRWNVTIPSIHWFTTMTGLIRGPLMEPVSVTTFLLLPFSILTKTLIQWCWDSQNKIPRHFFWVRPVLGWWSSECQNETFKKLSWRSGSGRRWRLALWLRSLYASRVYYETAGSDVCDLFVCSEWSVWFFSEESVLRPAPDVGELVSERDTMIVLILMQPLKLMGISVSHINILTA